MILSMPKSYGMTPEKNEIETLTNAADTITKLIDKLTELNMNSISYTYTDGIGGYTKANLITIRDALLHIKDITKIEQA